MSGLRETKKAATRTALSRAAAEIALREGPEAFTVAAIAAAAGVSPRTFHNYFPSREDALLEFVVIRVQELTDQLYEFPKNVPPRDAIEQLVINHLRDGDDALDSFSAMFQIGELLETLAPPKCLIDKDRLIAPMIEYLIERDKSLDRFDAGVLIQLHAAAIGTSLYAFYQSPEPRDMERCIELVRRACNWIKR